MEVVGDMRVIRGSASKEVFAKIMPAPKKAIREQQAVVTHGTDRDAVRIGRRLVELGQVLIKTSQPATGLNYIQTEARSLANELAALVSTKGGA